MTTSAIRPARLTPVAAPASRALLAAALAIVVTFSFDRTAPFGIVVLGVYLIAQALLLGAWSRRLAWTRAGTVLLLARAAVSLIGGVVLLTHVGGGIDVLRAVEAIVFLAVGALEVVGGVLGGEGPQASGDGVVVGGLQVVVGLMVVILNAAAPFSVGVLSAWGALAAVYLGIAAVNLRMTRRRR